MSNAQSSIRVAVRVRPLTSQEYLRRICVGSVKQDGTPSHNPNARVGDRPSAPIRLPLQEIVAVVDDKMLVFDPPLPAGSQSSKTNSFGRPVAGQRERKYIFDHVFGPESSQVQVYKDTAKPLLDEILEGYNASVFAYGATGCGKTFTISGPPQDPGLTFLAIEDLFDRLEQRKSTRDYQVSLSYLEIYNERIRDLLVDEASEREGHAGHDDLALREDANKRMFVPGLSMRHPKTVAEIMEWIDQGNSRRTKSATEANDVSSRSHAVIQIYLTQTDRLTGQEDTKTSSILSIIDLAGSERAATTKNRGKQLAEGANINRSLLALGKCITALSSRQRHVPYRDSKLTRLLKFSLGGNCKTAMIVCVSPSPSHYDETSNTLCYADRAKGIKTKAVRNFQTVDRYVLSYIKKIDAQKDDIIRLRSENEELRNLLGKGNESQTAFDVAQRIYNDAVRANRSFADYRQSQSEAVLNRLGYHISYERLRDIKSSISGIHAAEWQATLDAYLKPILQEYNKQSVNVDYLDDIIDEALARFKNQKEWSQQSECWLRASLDSLRDCTWREIYETAVQSSVQLDNFDEIVKIVLQGTAPPIASRFEPQVYTSDIAEAAAESISRPTHRLSSGSDTPTKRIRLHSENQILNRIRSTPCKLPSSDKHVHWDTGGNMDVSMSGLASSPFAPGQVNRSYATEKENRMDTC